MQSQKIGNGYMIRLEKGEEIAESLKRFCQEKGIKSGSISGIGATDNISIKYYDLEQKKYDSKHFGGENYEILSLNGNVSLLNNEPFTHLHITLADSHHHAFGGHLESAVISVTCEIALQMTDALVLRKRNEEFQLNFLELS